MLVELEKCRNELDWLLICSDRKVNNCPKEDYLPMPLPIPPDYVKNVERRVEIAKKDTLPPSDKMVLKKHFPLPARQTPVHPQHPEILSCSQ